MNTSHGLIIIMLLLNTCFVRSEDSSLQTSPKYIIGMNLGEYSIFTASEVEGLKKYGGSAEFHVKMMVENNDVIWNVTVESFRLMELMKIFFGEKVVKLIQGMDTSNIDSNSRVVLDTVKTLGKKIDYAQTNPIFKEIRLNGELNSNRGEWYILVDQKRLLLRGGVSNEFQNLKGKSVVVVGHSTNSGSFNVIRCFEKKPKTLQLFVMSHCPFGQRAEMSLFEFLDRKGAIDFQFEIHYIFYRRKVEGSDAYTSLHGEKEVAENLIQMLLRERYPKLFIDYLKLRNKNQSSSWTLLVKSLGLSDREILDLSKLIVDERDSMIENEYNYVANKYGILDKSPSFVWEGDTISKPNDVEMFSDWDTGFTLESCEK